MGPTFLIIGAAKSGTTSLHRYLNQHPDVFMSSPKEPHHFIPEATWRGWCGPGDQESVADYVADPAAYQALFDSEAQARGETSVFYYLHPDIIPTLPKVPKIVLLRDPVKRAYSNWLHLRRDGREPERSFEKALAKEQQRLADGWRPFWGYVEQGMYAKHLSPWLENDPDLLVLTLEEMQADPAATMRKVFQHIGVDDTFMPDTRARYNISGQVRSHRIRKRLISKRPLGGITRYLLPEGTRRAIAYRLQRLNTKYPEMTPATRRRLEATFRPDIERLEAMIGRRLPWGSS